MILIGKADASNTPNQRPLILVLSTEDDISKITNIALKSVNVSDLLRGAGGLGGTRSGDTGDGKNFSLRLEKISLDIM